MVRVVGVDVLVIGSGVAGLYAAIETSRHGVDVTLVSKSLLGRGGCSRMAAVFYSRHLPLTSSELEQDFQRQMQDMGYGLAEKCVMKRIIESGPEFARELEQMGIYWRRGLDDKIIIFPHPRYYVFASMHGETGARIVTCLRDEFLRRGITYLEETMVTSLLTYGGEVVGATALSLSNGEFFVIRAKAVILATGHAGGYLWRYSTATRDVCGDGVAMAYKVGTELIDLEMQTWHSSDQLWPESARRLVHQFIPIYPPIPGGHLLNVKGERLMPSERLTSKDTWVMAVWEQMKKGLTDKREGIFLSYRHLDEKDLKMLEDHYFIYSTIKKLGYDVPKDLVPVGTSAHTTNGGIRINELGETSVPRLYAAGGVCGNNFPVMHSGLWGGKVCSKQASNLARNSGVPKLDWKQIRNEEKRVFNLLRMKTSGGLSPAQIKRKIRNLMWDKMWFVKNERDMKEALGEIRKIRREAKRKMGLNSVTKIYNHEWVDALDVFFMLDVSELMIAASLMRKESRGCFQREDYQKTDEENWSKHIVLKLENGSLKAYTVPIG